MVNNITYDTELAETVKSGYLPVLDKVLESKKGICFDYAALMTGMLRSQSVPCKLVVGISCLDQCLYRKRRMDRQCHLF